jgi:two-component system, cell cycle sensor histidine kinase and response regulator CckA
MSAPELTRSRFPAPVRISLLYAAFGIAWILFGDLVLWLQGGVSRGALLTELVKGLVFVAASALLILFLIRREVTQRQRSASQLASVLATAPVGIAAIGPDGTIHRWNEAAQAILGWTESDVVGRSAADIGLAVAPTALTGGRDISVSGRGGESVPIRVFTSGTHAGADEPRVVVFLDRRREIETEGALRRAHKLEAVGRLAGGIAHEFNNILTTVMGHATLLSESLGPDDTRQEHASEVRRSAERAAVLTRQLLVFSGKHITRTAPVDVDSILKELAPAIAQTAGADVTVRYELASDLWAVRCDSAQLHQMVLNLVTNAREAMADGGTLTIIATNTCTLEPGSGDRPPAGEYLLLSVADTGRGMTQETLARLFEPFFTTKEQGTGLGLATVHGIVQQFEGHVRVSSRPGRGSRFDIYLPRATGDTRESPVEGVRVNGGATVLVVEDDDAVRELTCRVLRRSGHSVVSARNGIEGLDVLRSRDDVQLVIADIVMPGMNGVELGEHVRREFPHLPILFTSGYVAPDVGDAVGLADGSRFMEKPYRPEQLVSRVSELLHQP